VSAVADTIPGSNAIGDLVTGGPRFDPVRFVNEWAFKRSSNIKGAWELFKEFCNPIEACVPG
jgi:hypothetical protein